MDFKTHYKEKKISDLNEMDTNIRIMGFIVDKKDNILILDDGSSKVKIFTDATNVIDNLDVNQLVRIFGSVIPVENGIEIRADIIQDLSNLDIDLYKKSTRLYKILESGLDV